MAVSDQIESAPMRFSPGNLPVPTGNTDRGRSQAAVAGANDQNGDAGNKVSRCLAGASCLASVELSTCLDIGMTCRFRHASGRCHHPSHLCPTI